ncbi:conserved hypothetical protein [Gloeothece citriformis PCC 7424]|uniref:Uncharacterized protein n=1 Tax=Gloeothece citriformis (strain PCC 7424) TaxID=65393 RepID=B7KHS6_GLOC7|nr:Npun_F0494 family protein [Gloeothece citriformis]ACK72023.1 conserved hypothetical protein [Gloeothece citriformis PCC 7424]
MTLSSPQKQQPVHYSSQTVKRAEKALFCSPFHLILFKTMAAQSVPLLFISGQKGIESGYTKKKISEGRAEWELTWLIQVGLLRREVDGQGITDSFRLTPLGRQLLEKWETHEDKLPIPSIWDHLLNFWSRWLSISFFS